jgi:hypothetical protein
VVRFHVGFVGRSSTWRSILEMIFPEYINLRYMHTPSDCVDKDVVLAERYMVDLLGDCGEVRLVDGTVGVAMRELLLGLPVDNVVLGIDVGRSRNGIVILADDVPLIHHTLSRVDPLLDLLIDLRPTLVLGISPGVGPMIMQLTDRAMRMGLRVITVSEDRLSHRRTWFRERYPYLNPDELDGLIYAHAYGDGELALDPA